MVCAADGGGKGVGVTVEDIRGNCPQNMVLLAIIGDTASEAALEEIAERERGDTGMVTAKLIGNVWATRKAES